MGRHTGELGHIALVLQALSRERENKPFCGRRNRRARQARAPMAHATTHAPARSASDRTQSHNTPGSTRFDQAMNSTEREIARKREAMATDPFHWTRPGAPALRFGPLRPDVRVATFHRVSEDRSGKRIALPPAVA